LITSIVFNKKYEKYEPVQILIRIGYNKRCIFILIK